MTRALFILCFAAALLGQAPPADDALIWEQFERWVPALPPLPVGQKATFEERYVESLKQQGIPAEEAKRRFARVLALRRASVDRERVYWDGAFKSGAGPDAPLYLLQETALKMKPGKALDAGMGRGRNAIYLASLGWDTTGYDMSVEALKAAQASADKAGVKIKTVEAKHEDFDFGEEQWDLIVCSYNYMRPNDEKWPPILYRALKKGGVVVYQSSVQTRMPVAETAALWKQFRLLRVEDVDAGGVDNDWGPSRTNPTVKLVARKE